MVYRKAIKYWWNEKEPAREGARRRDFLVVADLALISEEVGREAARRPGLEIV